MNPATAIRSGRSVIITIGGLHASQDPCIIKTLLGSCIAACLYDPITRIGGMNHFMLPENQDSGGGSASELTRFGVNAMDQLIGVMMRLGADRRRFVAKIFGGAHVLETSEHAESVPKKNIRFIRTFLEEEGFPLLAEDVGGYNARQVQFSATEGMARVRKLASNATRSKLLVKERAKIVEPPPAFGAITLFD